MFDRVVTFLSDYMKDAPKEIHENTQLIADLGFNSLQMMQIVNDAELVFDIEIDDDELRDLVTVGDIVRLLEKKAVGN